MVSVCIWNGIRDSFEAELTGILWRDIVVLSKDDMGTRILEKSVARAELGPYPLEEVRCDATRETFAWLRGSTFTDEHVFRSCPRGARRVIFIVHYDALDDVSFGNDLATNFCKGKILGR